MKLVKLKLNKKKEKELTAKFGYVPTKEEIFERLKSSQERLIQSLAGALATAPEDPQTRQQLLEAVDKAVKLREKIYETMGEKAPKIKIYSQGMVIEPSGEEN